MNEYEKARLVALQEWIDRRSIAVTHIGEAKQMIKLLEKTMEGSRQQQSVGIDDILAGLRQVKTMLASVQHDIMEEPPE